LALSLSLKLVGATQTSGAADNELTTAKLKDFLAEERFVISSVAPFDEYQLVSAFRDACQIRAAIVPAEGFATEALRRLAADSDRIIFSFDGALYPDHPLVRSLLAKYVDRVLRGVHLIHYVRPVVGAISTGECGLEEMNWSKVSKFDFRALSRG
jgi:hypothetical protein